MDNEDSSTKETPCGDETGILRGLHKNPVLHVREHLKISSQLVGWIWLLIFRVVDASNHTHDYPDIHVSPRLAPPRTLLTPTNSYDLITTPETSKSSDAGSIASSA